MEWPVLRLESTIVSDGDALLLSKDNDREVFGKLCVLPWQFEGKRPFVSCAHSSWGEVVWAFEPASLVVVRAAESVLDAGPHRVGSAVKWVRSVVVQVSRDVDFLGHI